MLLYLKPLTEIFSFATNALRKNKLSTFLSLLGITLGIFSIIAVLAAKDSLDKKIKESLSSLDSNTLYLTSTPFWPTEVPRWKRDQFNKVSYDDYKQLKSSLTDAVMANT